MQKLDTRSCFSFAWETVKKRWWFMVGVSAALELISFIGSFVENFLMRDGGLVLAAIGLVIGLLVPIYVAFAQTHFYLKAHDAIGEIRFADAWKVSGLGKFALLYLGIGVISLIAYLLFIVPGILFSIAFMFSGLILVDTHTSVVASAKESMRLTRGNRWVLLGFLLQIFLLNVVGFLCVFVGLLVTIPVTMLATIHAYRLLQRSELPIAIS